MSQLPIFCYNSIVHLTHIVNAIFSCYHAEVSFYKHFFKFFFNIMFLSIIWEFYRMHLITLTSHSSKVYPPNLVPPHQVQFVQPIYSLEHGQIPNGQALKDNRVSLPPHLLPEAINWKGLPISIFVTILRTLFRGFQSRLFHCGGQVSQKPSMVLLTQENFWFFQNSAKG